MSDLNYRTGNFLAPACNAHPSLQQPVPPNNGQVNLHIPGQVH